MKNNQQPTNELSKADTKKLFILEKLKEERDLMPKEKMVTDIHPPKFYKWMRDCGIDDYTQFINVLDSLKEEELLTSIKPTNPAR